MATHIVQPGFSTPAGSIAAIQRSYTPTGGDSINVAQATGTTNTQYQLAFTIASLKSCCLISDQAVTLKFNSTGSPAPQIILAAGVPYIWNTDEYFVNLLTANVTTVYITNNSGATANISLHFAYTA